jgi:hypothetical protein
MGTRVTVSDLQNLKETKGEKYPKRKNLSVIALPQILLGRGKQVLVEARQQTTAAFHCTGPLLLKGQGSG